MSNPLTIWCNAHLTDHANELLRRGVGDHRLVLADNPTGNLAAGKPDDALDHADIAMGQPDPEQIIGSPQLRWVHLTSAGYTRYDNDRFRDALRGRGAMLSNSSSVYDEPCAQHLLAMILARTRQLPRAWEDQAGPRLWPAPMLRSNSFLLNGQTALILGFGAIARRLAQLLQPLEMKLIAVRQTVRGDEPIEVHSVADLDSLLPLADHVIDILPASDRTAHFVNAGTFARMKDGAIFYNIGRGTTVDHRALRAALIGGKLSAAFLDVTDPEPLPPEHPLWATPNCFITPHVGGGHHDEFDRLARHFLANFERFERGEAIRDRVM